jgi:hypothetical protein
MSWKPQVQVASETWYDYALRFATEEEARRYALDLFYRQTGATAHNAILSIDPVNYTYSDAGRLKPVEK